jgi:hypothetical protein
VVQASLALIGFALGASAWWTLRDWRWRSDGSTGIVFHEGAEGFLPVKARK